MNNINNFRKIYNNYNIILLNNKSINKYKDKYDILVKLFHKITIPTLKSDIIRFIFLYEEGGIWLDTHITLIDNNSINIIYNRLKNYDFSILRINHLNYKLKISILISKKKSKILEESINIMTTKLLEHYNKESLTDKYISYNFFLWTSYTIIKLLKYNYKYNNKYKKIYDNKNNIISIDSKEFKKYNCGVITIDKLFKLYSFKRDIKNHWSELQKKQRLFNIKYKTDKLNNLPYILWINMTRSKDRFNNMKKLFNEYNIIKEKRIEAYDGKNNNNFCIKDNNINITNSEYACLSSHLKALKYFIDNINNEYCIICEDDISFEFIKYWKKNFNEYINELNNTYNIIILCPNNHNKKFEIKMIKYNYLNVHGAVCYLINKSSAKKIINKIQIENNMYNFKKFNTKKRFDLISDKFIYKDISNIYYIPLITYTNINSTIHNAHLNSHIKNKNNIHKEWIKYYNK